MMDQMDQSAFPNQSLRWRRTFLHPAVLTPGIVGSAMLALNYMGLFTGLLDGSAGIAFGLLTLSLGAAVWRATVGSAAIRSQTDQESQQKRKRAHLEYLRDLRRKMRRDRDPRTGDLVTKLRTIYQQLEQSADTASTDYGGILPQIHEQANELYRSCLALLEHSFDLWDTGRSLTDKTNRESLITERETILEEVQQSVEHLDQTMDELRKATLRRNQSNRGHDSAAEQAHLRDELSMGIETARAVEERMVRLEQELGMRSRD